MKVLFVDDNEVERRVYELYLEQLGYRVLIGESGERAISLFQNSHPDVILLDVVMPGMDGYETARRIRAIEEEWTPIIFLSVRTDPGDIMKAIEAGGDDYLAKPINKTVLGAKMKAMQRIADMRRQLTSTTQALEQANQELQWMLGVDALTGLSNRRRLDRILMREIAHCARHKQPMSVIMADIDHFKAFNDCYGHLAGDECLQQVAKAMQDETLRLTDLIARYGGEEFCVILPNTTTEGATQVAQRMQEAVAALSIDHEANEGIGRVTLSYGVSTHVPDSSFEVKRILHEADMALYSAKQNGRNQIQCYDLGGDH